MKKTSIFHKKYFIPASFIFLDLVFIRWVLVHFLNWGIYDWDYQQTLLEVSRSSILKYHQIPLWNPFIGGGFTLAGDSLNHTWGPCFVPVLLFGTIIGIKICTFVYLLLAQFGMYILARYRGLSEEGAFLSAILYTLGGFYAHRLTHGHFEWIAAAWIPFIVLTIHKNTEVLNKISICLGGIFLAFLFLDGGPYQFAFLMVFLGIYTTLLAYKHKNTRPIIALVLVFIIGVGLSSVKLYPAYETFKDYPRKIPEDNFCGAPFTPTALDIFNQMFVSRNQIHRPDAWMPYFLNVGCYVGWVPLILAFTAVIMRPRRNWPLYVTTMIFLWIALGSAAPLNLWEPLHKLPGFSSLRLPIRFNVFILLLLALLSGEGIQLIKEKISKDQRTRFIPVIIVTIIAFDLVWVNGQIFKVAFSVPPIEIRKNDDFKHYFKSPHLIKYRKRALYSTFPNWPGAVFPAVLENRGVVRTYRPVPFVSYAIPLEHPSYPGESWFMGAKGKVIKCKITPNKILVETDGQGKILIINMNYDSGWKNRGKTALKIYPLNGGGLIAVELQPGQKKCELVYRPSSFYLGSFISMSTLLIISFFILHHQKTGKITDCSKAH